MYSKTTNGITVTVTPSYLEDHSEPEDDHYVWAYHITIENKRDESFQLCSRYWKITDSNGLTQEIKGDGVVGEHPHLTPGQCYEYTSGAPLGTPGGIMEGTYHLETQEGKIFTVDIPAFSLDSPYEISVLH